MGLDGGVRNESSDLTGYCDDPDRGQVLHSCLTRYRVGRRELDGRPKGRVSGRFEDSEGVESSWTGLAGSAGVEKRRSFARWHLRQKVFVLLEEAGTLCSPTQQSTKENSRAAEGV